MKFHPMLAVGLLAATAPVHAADNGIYLGGALSRSDIQTDTEFFGFSDEDTAYKLIAGIRPFDALAFEINYVDFGDLLFDNTGEVSDGWRSEFEATALDAFAVGFVNLPVVELFGKFGAVYWDAEATLQGGIGGVDLRNSDTGTDLAWGGGAQAQLGSFAIRLEYESFEIEDADEIELWSLGFTYTFL